MLALDTPSTDEEEPAVLIFLRGALLGTLLLCGTAVAACERKSPEPAAPTDAPAGAPAQQAQAPLPCPTFDEPTVMTANRFLGGFIRAELAGVLLEGIGGLPPVGCFVLEGPGEGCESPIVAADAGVRSVHLKDRNREEVAATIVYDLIGRLVLVPETEVPDPDAVPAEAHAERKATLVYRFEPDPGRVEETYGLRWYNDTWRIVEPATLCGHASRRALEESLGAELIDWSGYDEAVAALRPAGAGADASGGVAPAESTEDGGAEGSRAPAETTPERSPEHP